MFASAEPLDEQTLTARMPDGVDVAAALDRLQRDYAARGVNLVRVAGKWTFRTAVDLAWLLARESIERAVLAVTWIDRPPAISWPCWLSSSSTIAPLLSKKR